MTRRADLLARAARCYQDAQLYAEAGRCYREAGHQLLAGRAFQEAGDFERAAECFRAGAEFAAAAGLYERLGRPGDAAACWEEAREPLRAGWVLATRTRRFNQAAGLFDRATGADPATRLGRRLGLAVCRARGARLTGPLERAVEACERELPAITAGRDRRHVEEWAVEAADLLGRHDLAAWVFASSYRAGTPGAAGRWRRWAVATLGDTFGLPAGEGG